MRYKINELFQIMRMLPEERMGLRRWLKKLKLPKYESVAHGFCDKRVKFAQNKAPLVPPVQYEKNI